MPKHILDQRIKDLEHVYDYTDKMIAAKDDLGCILLMFATEFIYKDHRPEGRWLLEHQMLSTKVADDKVFKQLQEAPPTLREKISRALGRQWGDNYVSFIHFVAETKQLAPRKAEKDYYYELVQLLARHIKTNYIHKQQLEEFAAKK